MIPQIEPEAVFHSNLNEEKYQNECEDEDGMNIDINFVEEDDGLELELNFSTEEYSNYSEEEYSDYSEEESFIESSSSSSSEMTNLLQEIDEEFFKSKKNQIKTSENGIIIKIKSFGLKLNLILSDLDVITINLNETNGHLTADSIDLKVKEGRIEKSANKGTLLGRWQRGPDTSFKYPIEDGSFVGIKGEKTGNGNGGIDEYNLTISTCPMRLFLDQKLLNLIMKFVSKTEIETEKTHIKNGNENQTKINVKRFIFFNKVNISALALKIDYNPNTSSTSTPPIPLEGAEMILPRIELRGIKGLGGLGPAILSSWIPELKGKKLTGILASGLIPVRTIVNLGGGVVELILLPWQCNKYLSTGKGKTKPGPSISAAQTAAQIRRSSKQIGLETLKLTATIASKTSKLLTPAPKIPHPCQSYPRDFQTGIQQAAQLIIALPTRLHHHRNNQPKTQKGSLRILPLFILDSAAVATGAVAKTLQGIQAEFDKETEIDRKVKRRS